MIRRFAAAAAAGLVLASAGLAGCSSGGVSTSAGATASATPAAGSTLDPAAFAAAIKQPGTVLVDVRTPAEFAAGHLPNATLIDFESPDFATKIAALDKTKTYALYCRSSNRSGQAMALMQQAGFTSVYHLGGGINAWTAAGGNTVKG